MKWLKTHLKSRALYLPLVAGDFDVLKDTRTTKSGKDVELALFVDKGNLSKTLHASSFHFKKANAMGWKNALVYEYSSLEYLYDCSRRFFQHLGRWKIKG
ncbi:hypothetical protein P4S63_24735 [Pseudoalteromonas sp. B193]